MCCFCSTKNQSFTAVWIIAVMFSAMTASVAGRTPQAALVIDSACKKISEGDFEAAKRIVDRSTLSNSQNLRAIANVIDEYAAIKTRRKALRNKIYQTQTDNLNELRQKDFPDDATGIGKIFTLILNISEYADERQKRSLLKDPLLKQAVRKAKAKAAVFETQGKWLDAYTVCYSNLMLIYQDNEAYSDHADQLLKKADILSSLQDTPCETRQERHAGIVKEMFTNAVDILDTGYVNIIDYRQMATKGIDRCQLLAEVMTRLDAGNEYKMTDAQYTAWSNALGKIAHGIDRSRTDMDKNKFTDVLNKVLELSEYSRGPAALSDALLIVQFTKGSMSALDPYTSIYWPSQVKDFEKAVTNQFSGIGIKFSKKQGLAKVVNVLPDTPAYRSGLQAGDIIRAIDGVETKDIPSDCVLKMITGPENTKVTLTIKSSGEDKTRDITLGRARITVPSVHGWQRNKKGKWLHMINGADKIGYVRISSFDSRTTDDFETVLCQLEKDGLKGLVLDLRSNPGGLLSAAAEIADKFISRGLILRTQPRFGISTYISAHRENTHAACPIVVLINPSTASASEILAGVLQDKKYKSAVLVGQRSYGKGSVQSITSYCGKGAQLKYTMAYYHLPSGQRVESRYLMEMAGRTDWGILPDVNVELQSNELLEIAKVQKANEFLPTTKKRNTSGGMDRYSSQQTIDADPQLAIGLLVLKSKMMQFRNRSVTGGCLFAAKRISGL